ncbi:MAG: hypothetical protein KAY54_06345 [Burkholderiaceae bacterium]|nr:hypothetical protein [Burkholderiaceae bacterium]
MPNASAERFQFIAYALRGDGPFRPVVSNDGMGNATMSGYSYLVRYPRESVAKYNRRNEIAFYSSPLAQACGRFSGYLASQAVVREIPNPLFQAIADNVDGKGNSIDVFLTQFTVQAKARGSMLLLVDMPPATARTLAEQMATRAVPYWSAIKPESVTDYAIGDDGKFDYVEFSGDYTREDGSRVACTWHFDREGWSAHDTEKKPLDADQHGLGECPVLIFTEGGDFPFFGSFAAIADISKRIFNADSELDEILRSQTFSLLTMQVPEASTDAQKLSAAQVAGETIGTSNLMVHSGSTPAFIAPQDGPARIYLDRIKDLRQQIDEVGLNVATVNQQESGIAMQMRFAAINGELAYFSTRMEDLERRAWELSRRWLGLSQEPVVQWPRDFNIADVEQELRILSEMQASNMPAPVIAEQQRRIVAVQFGGLDPERKDEIMQAIDEPMLEPAQGENVVPLRPDTNAGLREAVIRAVGGSSGGA